MGYVEGDDMNIEVIIDVTDDMPTGVTEWLLWRNYKLEAAGVKLDEDGNVTGTLDSFNDPANFGRTRYVWAPE